MELLKRILLIEDDENISFGIKTYLEKKDFIVEIGDNLTIGKK